MSTMDIHGYRIHYAAYGQGIPILFLHHGFGCSRMWEPLLPDFLDAGYRVILYDRRGYGESEAGDDFVRFYVSEAFCQASVRELDALRTNLGLERIHIVGQCEGGVVGAHYAAAHPDNVQTLVMASTQCFSPVGMPEFNRQKFTKSFRELEPALIRKLETWHGADRAEAFYEQFRTEGGAYGTGDFDLRPVLSTICCPAMVLYPDRSFLFPVAQALEMYRALAEGELAVIPGCGHNTYEQKPELYTRLIFDFLSRHTE